MACFAIFFATSPGTNNYRPRLLQRTNCFDRWSNRTVGLVGGPPRFRNGRRKRARHEPLAAEQQLALCVRLIRLVSWPARPARGFRRYAWGTGRCTDGIHAGTLLGGDFLDVLEDLRRARLSLRIRKFGFMTRARFVFPQLWRSHPRRRQGFDCDHAGAGGLWHAGAKIDAGRPRALRFEPPSEAAARKGLSGRGRGFHAGPRHAVPANGRLVAAWTVKTGPRPANTSAGACVRFQGGEVACGALKFRPSSTAPRPAHLRHFSIGWKRGRSLGGCVSTTLSLPADATTRTLPVNSSY